MSCVGKGLGRNFSRGGLPANFQIPKGGGECSTLIFDCTSKTAYFFFCWNILEKKHQCPGVLSNNSMRAHNWRTMLAKNFNCQFLKINNLWQVPAVLSLYRCSNISGVGPNATIFGIHFTAICCFCTFRGRCWHSNTRTHLHFINKRRVYWRRRRTKMIDV